MSQRSKYGLLAFGFAVLLFAIGFGGLVVIAKSEPGPEPTPLFDQLLELQKESQKWHRENDPRVRRPQLP